MTSSEMSQNVYEVEVRGTLPDGTVGKALLLLPAEFLDDVVNRNESLGVILTHVINDVRAAQGLEPLDA